MYNPVGNSGKNVDNSKKAKIAKLYTGYAEVIHGVIHKFGMVRAVDG